MKRYLLIFITFIFIFAVFVSSRAQNNNSPTSSEILKEVALMEKALNKSIPSYNDFRQFYHGEGESEREILPKDDYCAKILKFEPNSIPCDEAINKLNKDLNLFPSFYLTNIKFTLSDGKKQPIKLFISPNIDFNKCKKENLQTIEVDGVAMIETKIYKRLKYVFPCTQTMRELYNINITEIDGVKEYRFSIPGPLKKLK